MIGNPERRNSIVKAITEEGLTTRAAAAKLGIPWGTVCSVARAHRHPESRAHDLNKRKERWRVYGKPKDNRIRWNKPYIPVPRPPAVESSPVDIDHLSNSVCKWPLWRDKEAKTYCGAPVMIGSWCAGHYAIAFRR